MIKKFKEKIKQYAQLTGEHEVEVYFMLVPIVAAVIVFILAVFLTQSFFVPMVFIASVALFYIASQAVNAFIQSISTFVDVLLLPSHEEPSILD